jgi:hypothetical protein
MHITTVSLDDDTAAWLSKQPKEFNLSKHVRRMIQEMIRAEKHVAEKPPFSGNDGLSNEDLVEEEETVENDEPMEEPSYDSDESQPI